MAPSPSLPDAVHDQSNRTNKAPDADNGIAEQVSWISLNSPQATLSYMIENDLIDADKPAESLLLMKPTVQVKHEGGQKMVVGDRTYKQFRRFVDDYAAIVQGKYKQASHLPPQSREVSVVTEIWFKIEGVPAKYDKMLLQAYLYRQTDSGWSEYRVASSDRPVCTLSV